MTFKFFSSSQLKKSWNYRSEPESMHVLAEELWAILLIFAFIVLIFSVAFGAGEMSAVSQAENVTPAVSAVSSPLDPVKLQDSLATFSARQGTYQALTQTPLPQVADPSK